LRRTTCRYRQRTPAIRKEYVMGKVTASASMSLDGYIAKDDNTIGRCSIGSRTGK
jgi:hypothetical protein